MLLSIFSRCPPCPLDNGGFRMELIRVFIRDTIALFVDELTASERLSVPLCDLLNDVPSLCLPRVSFPSFTSLYILSCSVIMA